MRMVAVNAAGVLALAALASLALLALGDRAGRPSLLQFVPRASLADGEVVYQPRRAGISFLPQAFLYEFPEYPPSYNNHKLREAACFGFDRNPGPPDYDNWTPDDHALWCQPDADTRIGDPRMRGNEELRTGNLIGEGNALIDFNEYNNVDSSMGEAQREVVDRIR